MRTDRDGAGSEADRIAALEAENAALRRLAGIGARPGWDAAHASVDARIVEVVHLARNTLAMVRAIIRRSAGDVRTAEDCVMRLDGRLGAIARVQSAGLLAPATGVDLHTLIADELFAHLAREGEQADLSGPRVLLRPKAAEIFALAVHELAVNALEHGALTRADGRIRVLWSLIPGPAVPILSLAWTETGLTDLPPVAPRQGFGTEMLERTLRYEIGAETSIAYAPAGLRCTIRFPLAPRVGAAPEQGSA